MCARMTTAIEQCQKWKKKQKKQQQKQQEHLQLLNANKDTSRK